MLNLKRETLPIFNPSSIKTGTCYDRTTCYNNITISRARHIGNISPLVHVIYDTLLRPPYLHDTIAEKIKILDQIVLFEYVPYEGFQYGDVVTRCGATHESGNG